jgi:CubicO group peptidase (beta-lactamase class C family)
LAVQTARENVFGRSERLVLPAALRAELERLVAAVMPWLLELPGVGPISAAQVLVSRSHAARRRAGGKSIREIRRCLKRAVARQLFKLLERLASLGCNWRTSPSSLGVASCRHLEGGAQLAQQAGVATAAGERAPCTTRSALSWCATASDHPVLATAGAADRRRWWPGFILVALTVVLAACTGPSGQRSTPSSQLGSAAPSQRDYWPTTGWRTAPPQAEGMDPAVLAAIPGNVSSLHPEVRSVLVVRHGYLVYERYWHGMTARHGDNLYSVTKSVVSALVGIALGEGKLTGLDQPVGELLASQLPKDADPRLARVTLEQLLTMTSGLAGDDPSLGGDPRISQRQGASRDWVRHILGRRLATNPGSSFAYSSATSQLLSAIVADATGVSTLAFARARLFGPLGINSANAPAPVLVAHPSPATVKAYARAPVAWPTDPLDLPPGGGHRGYAAVVDGSGLRMRRCCSHSSGGR